MSTRHTVSIDGIIVATSPIHISAPGKNQRFDPETNRVIYDSQTRGLPLTQTRKMQFRLNISDDALGRDEDQEEATSSQAFVTVPVLPSNGLRGHLRRLAAACVEDAIGEPIPWDVYQMLHCGAVTGRGPNSATPSLSDVRAQRDHVMMGLFGGGPMLQPGYLRVSNAIPPIEDLCAMGVVPKERAGNHVIRLSEARRLLQCGPTNRVDDLSQFRDPRAGEVVADLEGTMLHLLESDAKHKAQRLRKTAAAKEPSPTPAGAEEEETSAKGARHLSFIEFITPGTPFYFRLGMHGGNAAQAGLLLTIVQRFLRDETIGGKSAIGYGQFTFDDMQVTIDGESAALFGPSASFNTGFAPIAACLEAYHETLASLTIPQLNEMVKPDAAA